MPPKSSPDRPKQKIAIIGAGMAGLACARTLAQAGHNVTVFEKSRGVGGRMATRRTPFGTFDHGAQYFTVRDPRFELALTTANGICRPWSANTVRVLDEFGQVAAAGLPQKESHWVPKPGMSALCKHWAKPLELTNSLYLEMHVHSIEKDSLRPSQWQLRTEGTDQGQHVFPGFDKVLFALPSPQTLQILNKSLLETQWKQQLIKVDIAPCWTLMLAFPNAMQPGMSTLGPHWNVARSTHHRIAWVARESSKPGRSSVERWTIQASSVWSQKHLEDDPTRAKAKLIKAFTEVTGIRAEPSHIDIQRWRYAQTTQPLGKTHLYDEKFGLGICGDWCLGHRVENAFISGLELALAVAKRNT